jgi:hypothetical protein
MSVTGGTNLRLLPAGTFPNPVSTTVVTVSYTPGGGGGGGGGDGGCTTGENAGLNLMVLLGVLGMMFVALRASRKLA